MVVGKKAFSNCLMPYYTTWYDFIMECSNVGRFYMYMYIRYYLHVNLAAIAMSTSQIIILYNDNEGE